MTRTTKTSLVFARPFSLAATDRIQPPGSYIVETDEEQIEGVAFIAFRRVATRIVLAPDPSRPGCSETVDVDPRELVAAQGQDVVNL